jgi:hypothetical protein
LPELANLPRGRHKDQKYSESDMAEHAIRASEDRARRDEAAPARRGLPHAALEERAPVHAQSALARLLNSRPAGPAPAQRVATSRGQVVQLALSTSGKKISGAAALVKKEVRAVIARDKPSELLADIALLETSIAFRKTEQQASNPKTNPKAYKSHADRIDMEESQRVKLQSAYDANKRARDQAKAVAAVAAPPAAPVAIPDDGQGQWTTVKRK